MIFYLLTAVLAVLKLLGIITCSWWLVAAPAIITLALTILFVIGVLIAAYIIGNESRSPWKR